MIAPGTRRSSQGPTAGKRVGARGVHPNDAHTSASATPQWSLLGRRRTRPRPHPAPTPNSRPSHAERGENLEPLRGWVARRCRALARATPNLTRCVSPSCSMVSTCLRGTVRWPSRCRYAAAAARVSVHRSARTAPAADCSFGSVTSTPFSARYAAIRFFGEPRLGIPRWIDTGRHGLGEGVDPTGGRRPRPSPSRGHSPHVRRRRARGPREGCVSTMTAKRFRSHGVDPDAKTFPRTCRPP